MRRHKQESPAVLGQSDAGDMWLALARLHAAHRDPVGRLVSFERPEVLLALTEPDEVLVTARVELSGMETMSHLHDLIRTVTHGVTAELGHAGPGSHWRSWSASATNSSCTRPTLTASSGSCARPSTPSGPAARPGGGRCFHCDGTGRAHPLWEPATGQA
ncbi:hypothetical protein [Streptomyces goshikiensis]|uniref:hypothetical protein n=1 Tax=Streptomyces goshikiensis TaxID=1942 RepID=UPI003664251C